MSKPVILTGLRANNDLHIGNYLGAILPMVDMAKQKAGEYQINMFVPDLHSFTTPIEHYGLQKAIMNNVRVYVAAGLPLDNQDVHVYRQSFIPAHSELTWILDCFTGMGEMSRMTQFKDKAGSRPHVEKLTTLSDKGQRITDEAQEIQKLIDKSDDLDTLRGLNKDLMAKVRASIENNTEFVRELTTMMDKEGQARVGLFNYPVLMAADILLYGATYVPVGDDQTQHLEFTRDIGERLNSKFQRELFVLPKPVKEQHKFFGKDQGLRIKDLQDPSKKMSKSDDSGKGVIFLSDTPDIARKKIMSAVTDDLAQVNYDHEKQPGISNLLDLLALTSGQNIGQVAKKYQGATMYGTVKTDVADAVCAFLEDFQTKLASVEDTQLLAKLVVSEEAMSKQADKTLLEVQKAVGLRP